MSRFPCASTLYRSHGIIIASERSLALPFAARHQRPDLHLARIETIAGPDASDRIIHREADFTGGPILTLCLGARGRLWIDYADRWRTIIDPDHTHIIEWSEQGAQGAALFGQYIERVVMPLYLLWTHNSYLGLHGCAHLVARSGVRVCGTERRWEIDHSSGACAPRWVVDGR